MTPLLSIATKSAWNRRSTLFLVVVSVALATFLLLSIERLRTDVHNSFHEAVSGTDLIVGARTGPVQLMLYVVFRMGGTPHNIRMSSVRSIATHQGVEWVVPISLGDSHLNFPVLGTTPEYFTRYLYSDRRSLQFAQGQPFRGGVTGISDAVLGAEVAKRLGYRLNDGITLSHGSGSGPGADHDDKPFTVVGILAPTGTPVDRTVHVSLHAMQAIHLNWFGGVPLPGQAITSDQVRESDLEPRQVTAALLGLKNRNTIFSMQRHVSEFKAEPLMAVLPGVALADLWDVVSVGERALFAMSALVAVVSLVGLIAVVMAGLNERRRELAVLRALGAAPRHIFVLLTSEGVLVTLLGMAAGTLLAFAAVLLAAPWIQAHLGIAVRLSAATGSELALLAGIATAGALASLVPALRAYLLSLEDGLSPRI